MATFYSTIKSLSVGNKSAVANFHNGVFSTKNEAEIKMLRIAMKNNDYCITEAKETVEAVKEAVKEMEEVPEVTEEATAQEVDKPKKKTASKKK